MIWWDVISLSWRWESGRTKLLWCTNVRKYFAELQPWQKSYPLVTFVTGSDTKKSFKPGNPSPCIQPSTRHSLAPIYKVTRCRWDKQIFIWGSKGQGRAGRLPGRQEKRWQAGRQAVVRCVLPFTWSCAVCVTVAAALLTRQV